MPKHLSPIGNSSVGICYGCPATQGHRDLKISQNLRRDNWTEVQENFASNPTYKSPPQCTRKSLVRKYISCALNAISISSSTAFSSFFCNISLFLKLREIYNSFLLCFQTNLTEGVETCGPQQILSWNSY